MVEKADEWGMPLSQFKETHTRYDLYTLLALRYLQNEENDVFIDAETKERRKGQLAKLNKKRESMLSEINQKSNFTQEELEDLKLKAKQRRQQQQKKAEEHRKRFQEMRNKSVTMKQPPRSNR